ncbi:MAG: transglutaminase family protein [bacterium]|nr:transglutaminase family protein [bacterium]
MQTLQPTKFIDADHPAIRQFVDETVAGVIDARVQATRLYYRVRDEIRYEPYRISFDPEAMRASATLKRGDGFCVAKSVLLAAAARAAGIPARLGFADVRNHLATDKLLDALGTDIFAWHGYTDLYLDGQWVKATPAFNLSLCEKFGVKPLEFDGTADSIFHPYDIHGNRHMEYVKDHGTYDDLPLELLVSEYQAFYPKWTASLEGDFGEDAASERSQSDSA